MHEKRKKLQCFVIYKLALILEVQPWLPVTDSNCIGHTSEYSREINLDR